ncbi:hypothetical protein H3S75_10100 [Gilliamella sp. B14384G15]|uniref:hypothetical protein n=1 Tax=unclassified Gilliamella TaxID=2685620 RepID=UPI0018DCF1AB|nr:MULTISPECIES: hypothetical protein [unclassified Gilliamella]MBI0031584.1 hypothetical protein [Gilliamella sp. B14384G15]MBI0058943.1 hypothetical protein [Gilliamella sp. B14384G12]
MEKIFYCLLLFPFFVFADDFYNCKYAMGTETEENLNYLANGTVRVTNDRFVAKDLTHKEHKSPKFTEFTEFADNLSIAEDSEKVYVLANDRTKYVITTKIGNLVFKWGNCTLDLSIDFENEKFGNKPVNFFPKIKSYFRDVLKDPDSAKYSNISKPQKDFIIEYGEVVTGYSVCLYVNAKNSFGSYTGKKLYWAFLKDNKLLRVNDAQDSIVITRWHNISCSY